MKILYREEIQNFFELHVRMNVKNINKYMDHHFHN